MHIWCVFSVVHGNFGCVVEACCGAAVRLAVQKAMFKFELDRRLPALLTGPMCDWSFFFPAAASQKIDAQVPSHM